MNWAKAIALAWRALTFICAAHQIISNLNSFSDLFNRLNSLESEITRLTENLPCPEETAVHSAKG